MTLAALRALMEDEAAQPAAVTSALAYVDGTPRVVLDVPANDVEGWGDEAPANDNAMSEDEARDAIEEAWRAGLLEYKLDAHQAEVDDLFEEWNERRRTPEYIELCKSLDGAIDDVWVEKMARRFGKTAKWIIKLSARAIRHPGSVFTYGCAFQKDIGEIVVPLANMLLADGPDDVRPKYQSSKDESHQGLYFPNGSVIKLVGVDKHPDALRGRFSDGVVLSEAGFVKNLESTVRAVLLPQFQRRRWAFLVLESSAPKQADHDFNQVFVPDAQARGAYQERTIDDNTALSEDEKQKFIRQAGGRGHPVCEREYFNKDVREKSEMVVPEFDAAVHVREHTRPAHAFAYVAADPGSVDLFGLVFGYWDFLAAKAIEEASWAARDPSTRQVACVVAAYEWLLWGRWPHTKMHTIPARRERDHDGWAECLVGINHDDIGELSKRLHAMANTPDKERPPTQWVSRTTPPEHFTYWDGRCWKQNPCERRTDVDPQLVRDLSSEYGIDFMATEKDDAEAHRNRLRDGIGAGKVRFLPTAGPVIQHVEHARWKVSEDGHRKDYERHKSHGHFDCLAALTYQYRNMQQNRNPFAPAAHALDAAAEFALVRPDYKTPEAAALERAFGTGKAQQWKPSAQRWRPSR